MKIKEYVKQNHLIPICCAAFVHWLITFYTDTRIFTVPPSENLMDYSICKILALFALFFLYRTLYRVLLGAGRNKTAEFQVLKYALFCLIPILIILLVKLPQGFLSNDESLIFESASTLQHYTWFYYITTYYYMISMMLIPSWLGPIIIKVMIQMLVIGYVVYRLTKYLGIKYGKFGYLPFLLYPVIAYTASAHRLPIYYLLYLLLIVMLLFDLLEKRPLTRPRAFGILLLGAVLTQWRTEGIYLAVLLPILLLLVYTNLRNRKSVLYILLATFAIQYIVSIPQNGLIANEMGAAANDRMKPFYAYTITNMYRNGLDYEKNREDLAIVDRYLSLESIAAINEYYGEINYEDVLILYQEGFVGVRPEAGPTEFFAYAAALKRICIHNPDVFFRTRWGAFCYAAQPYHIVFEGTGLRQLLSFCLSIVKTLAYNLFLPCIILLVLCIFSLCRKRWFTFFVTGGLIAHWFIVFVLAPASYFKYYFPVYMTAYFYLFLLLLQLVYNHFHKEDQIQFLR